MAENSTGSGSKFAAVVAVLATLGSMVGSALVTFTFESITEDRKNYALRMQELQLELQDTSMKLFTALQDLNSDVLVGNTADPSKRMKALTALAEVEIKLNPNDPRWPDSVKPIAKELFDNTRTIQTGVKNVSDLKSLRPIIVGYQGFLTSKDMMVSELRKESRLSPSFLRIGGS